MKRRSLTILGILLSLSLPFQISAQKMQDSVAYGEFTSGIQALYFNEIRDNAQIYHGAQYIRNGLRAAGFPYYESNDMLPGEISYQGTTYHGRKMYYDLVSDQIIIANYQGNAQISLSPEKADSFRIGIHRYVQLKADKSSGLPKNGYYEVLSSGEPSLFVRREKRLETGSGSDETKYLQFNDYYLRKNFIYYRVDSKNSLLDLLKDDKPELKKYIRVNKLNFKKNFETSLVLAVNHIAR